MILRDELGGTVVGLYAPYQVRARTFGNAGGFQGIIQLLVGKPEACVLSSIA
jgi:hypothetical protein